MMIQVEVKGRETGERGVRPRRGSGLFLCLVLRSEKGEPDRRECKLVSRETPLM